MSWDSNSGVEMLEEQIADPIERVAQLICENRSAVEAQRVLHTPTFFLGFAANP